MGKLDRIFQEAQNAAAEEDGVPVRGLEAALKSGGDDDADAKRASLPIAERILADYEKGNFFACLGLPPPDCDDAGRPVWDVSESTISKAYRRASLAVHPDKNPLPEAKAAFDKLNDAVRALRDDVRRGEALRSFADAAFQDKCRANPELMAKAKKAQERVDAENYGDMIRAQQSQQLERARLQREKAKLIAIRRRNREADGASSSDVSTDTDSDNDDDDAKADAVMKDAVQVKAEKEKAGGEGVSNGGGDSATNGGGERKKFRGGRRKARADSDSDDDGGLARPVLGTKKKPRFIM